MTDQHDEQMVDPASIDRIAAPHPPGTPDPPSIEFADVDGLEELDPLGIGQMGDDLAALDATPDGAPRTYAEIKAAKRGRSAKVPMVLDTSKRIDLINARAELQEAETALSASPDDEDRRARVDTALEAVKTAEADLEAVTVVFELKSIARPRLRNLIAACPPSAEQRQRHNGRKSALSQAANEPLFNPDKFQPALVAACLVDPPLDIAEISEMWTDDEWTEGELESLFLTAWQLNQIAI